MSKRVRVAAIVFVSMVLVAAVALFGCAPKPAESSQSSHADQPAKVDALTKYWSADSNVAQQLREYVGKVTDPNDKDNFVPVEDRIAVFDMDFKYENGDELVFTGGFIQKALNANKSIYVEREIGQRPILAFGNSSSDTSVMNYAIDDRNPYPAQAYMVVADDTEREWGPQNWNEKAAEYTAMGYTPVSMKNDFGQIYPDGVTKGTMQYNKDDWTVNEEELRPAA